VSSRVKTKLPSAVKACGSLCPIQGAVGAQNGPAWRTANSAVVYILEKLNSQPAPPDPTLTTRERNIIIRARHAAGTSQADLARQFGISYQRVHRIVHGQRK
jgi:ribosome-binding protein aMBF1 (putative translation factor)